MDSPAENKRSAVLALALLGALLVGSLVVLVVFDGEDGAEADAKPGATTATRGAGTGKGTGAGSGAGAAAPQSGAASGVPPSFSPTTWARPTVRWPTTWRA